MIVNAADRTKNFTPAFEVKINVNNLEISIEDVCSRMSNNPRSLDEHFHKTIDKIFLLIPDKCHIRAGYVIYTANFDQTGVNNFRIGDTAFNMGKIVLSQLKKSRKAAVFACSIGPNMENWAREVMEEGNLAESYLIDMAASAITEKAVDYLHDYIGTEMSKQNLNITNRYSPGYCDWPVSDQHQLFSLLPENFCGIVLNESALMNPIKSVSGVIGIGENVIFKDYLCDRCRVMDCTYRIKNIKTANSIYEGIAL